MAYRKYNPIRIEALQPNGEWHVRNRFDHENAAVQSGEKPRDWLYNLASRVMTSWNIHEQHGKQLRITGGRNG
jgi:hypothetical protein